MKNISRYYKSTFYLNLLRVKLVFLILFHFACVAKGYILSLIKEIVESLISINVKYLAMFLFGLLLISGLFFGSHVYAVTLLDPGTNDGTLEQTGMGQWFGANDPNGGFFGITVLTITNSILGTPQPSSTGTTGERKGGAINTIGSVVGNMYSQQPESSMEYFAYLKNNAGFIHPAYAANGPGSGYGQLSLIMGFWTWTRNLAYLFLGLIMIIVSFIIMLRGKMGQMEVTVINTLPRIVMALILITFSYAIAGFIIDLMNVGLGIVANGIFSNGGPGAGVSPLCNGGAAVSFNPYDAPFSIWGITGTSCLSSSNYDFGMFSGAAGATNIGYGIGSFFNAVNGIASKIPGASGSGLSGVFSLIVAIAALFAIFKIFFSLLATYVTLIFLPVVAPLQFAFGSLPGRTGMITWWFKKMFSCIFTFIAVYTVFAFIYVIINSKALQGTYPSIPLLSLNTSSTPAGQPSGIQGLLAFGLLLITPNVPSMIDRVMGIQQGGADIGQQVGGAVRGAAQHVPIVGALF